ncbi:transposase [Catalinimonas alkaloidigena]|uniref:transposase n=1 Tax=Catalinimonas alkaloidigena TaxID=1075417 RepID=UPI0039775C80
MQLVGLPPYSPQLNADEQVHGYIKSHWFKNRLFTTISELKTAVAQGFTNLTQKPSLIAKFFYHPDVAFYTN